MRCPAFAVMGYCPGKEGYGDGIVFGAVAPHGFPIIPELSEDAEGGLATRAAMFELGGAVLRRSRTSSSWDAAWCARRRHGLPGLDGARSRDTPLAWRQIEMNVPLDRAATEAIAGAARELGVPVALAGFAGNRWDQSVIPLDWGR
jgi:hypothetical protein